MYSAAQKREPATAMAEEFAYEQEPDEQNLSYIN